MSRYATLADLKYYLSPNGTLSTSQDGLLQSSLDRAESAINDYTRRNFAGTAGTVYYNRYQADLVRSQALYLREDLHTLVGLQTGNGQNIPVGSVWLEPRNAGPPYRVLRLHSQYVYQWNTDSDVIISGTFGYGTTPPDAVVQATVRYAAHLFRQKDAGGMAGVDVAGFTDAGEVSFPKGMPDDVRWLLSPYRSRSGGVV